MKITFFKENLTQPNKNHLKNLDSESTNVRGLKDLLLRSCQIFEDLNHNYKYGPNYHRNRNSISRLKSGRRTQPVLDQEMGLNMIMKHNLESKEDIYTFFISKNVSHMLKCKFLFEFQQFLPYVLIYLGVFGRKSAINKAKKLAALTSKLTNRK